MYARVQSAGSRNTCGNKTPAITRCRAQRYRASVSPAAPSFRNIVSSTRGSTACITASVATVCESPPRAHSCSAAAQTASETADATHQVAREIAGRLIRDDDASKSAGSVIMMRTHTIVSISRGGGPIAWWTTLCMKTPSIGTRIATPAQRGKPRALQRCMWYSGSAQMTTPVAVLHAL